MNSLHFHFCIFCPVFGEKGTWFSYYDTNSFHFVVLGLRKSLFNVFHDGLCHPKMALVIDDRLKVWDEKDQPRVHVVPAFAPYYAPQAEVLHFMHYYLNF